MPRSYREAIDVEGIDDIPIYYITEMNFRYQDTDALIHMYEWYVKHASMMYVHQMTCAALITRPGRKTMQEVCKLSGKNDEYERQELLAWRKAIGIRNILIERGAMPDGHWIIRGRTSWRE